MDEAGRRHPLVAGRYRLLEELGRGGMGVVWLALDEVLDREVAAKEVRAPEHLSDDDVRVLYARLKQEARAAARVSHPNVITVHDVVEQEGRPWIVMELVRGESLDHVLRQEGPLQAKEAARVGALVLQALRAAHAVGVLHRDVKPANVLLEAGGRVVLTDFGIALVEGAGTLTRTGDLIGSAEYLAPERAMGRRPGIPSDLWSLGALLYVAVEGVSPFRRGDPLSTLRAVVDEAPAPPRRAGPLAPLLEGLLRKDPEARMGSAEAERLLEAVASGRVTEAPGYVRTTVDRPARPPAPDPTPTYVPYVPPPAPSQPVAPAAYGAPYPAPAAPARRMAARIVAAVVTLLLVAGGTIALFALRGGGSGGGQSPGGGSVSAPQQVSSDDQGATDTAEPTPTPTPTYENPTPTPQGTCNGGWVTSC
ncbi:MULTISPECIES: serine/threonine-protein kinase [Streptomyces]|uniref:non-specific serine/threonine protein kinase n=1 Tax=Streptomyces luteosporeus TaxID=173856 RepID=A0ABN3TLT6_9ACTN